MQVHAADQSDLFAQERREARSTPLAPPGQRPPGRPPLANPVVQALYAGLGSLVVAGGWFASDRIFGALLAFSLLLVPLINAPFAICLAFIVVSEFRIPEVFPVMMALRLPELTAIATLGTLIWHIFLTHRIRPFWSRELTLFALFTLHVSISAVLALDRPPAFGFWTSHYVKVIVIVFAVTWLAVGPRQFALASVVFVLSGLAVGLVALWNKTHGIGLVEGGRVTIGRDLGSSIGDPNDLALVLLFALAFCLGLAFTRGLPGFLRVMSLVAAGVVIAAILATQSRGGMLGTAAVFIPFIRRWIRSPVLLAVLAALSVVALYTMAGIGERGTVVAESEGGLDASAHGRLLAWEAAFRMALSDPLTGVGMQNFPLCYFFFTDEWHGRHVAAHSMWFEVLGENGFVGLALFIALMSVTAGTLTRARRRLDTAGAPVFARAMAISLVAGFYGLVVSGSFLSQAYGWPVAITMALSFAVSRYASAFLTNADAIPGAQPAGPLPAPSR